MEELVKWYWDYGVKRGYDINDQDRELRKIPVGGWLDSVVKILERDSAIRSNMSSKACLALWGPSQTGKSTLMSQYVDGELANGFDSALTWSDNHKTRFSPPKEGMEFLQGNYPDTLVFNPYNHQSDASGVATRYTLHSESDDSVNPEYPIEIKFTTRAQIIQSLSLGYISECEQKISDRQVSYTQESFMEELAAEGGGRTDSESPEAYWLLKDIANVIEFMRSDPRFYYLFNRGDWDRKVRKALVSSPALLGDIGNAERFMAKIFWDSADRLTRCYKNAEKMLNDLSREWEGCRVLATMEVGALLLDIDSFQSYVAPKGEKGQQVKDKVSRLAFERAGNEVHILLRSGGSKISGEAFGCFQAICAELNVPLKKERLEKDPQKRHFAELAEKCDFLDFPGVSNKNTGNAVGNGTAEKIDIDNADEAEVFTKVFKQGKTQCFVYNYAKKYGIDAFAVLVRTDRPPSKSSLLNTGISEWLCSFDERWTPGKTGVMPVFVNMTFFANLINSVSMNGLGAGLAPYVERLGELTFARKETAQIFATTYPLFHDGKIDNPEQKDTIVSAILKDQVFTHNTGMTEEGLRAVFSPDGGVDYMIKNMALRIDASRRRSHCRMILGQDRDELLRLIKCQLPSDEAQSANEQKSKLRDLRHKVEEILGRIEEEDDTSKYMEFAVCVKKLFSASSAVFDALPLAAEHMSKKEIKEYVKKQIAKWYDYKTANLEECDYLSKEEMQAVLASLRDTADTESLFRFIKDNYSQINNRVMAEAARYPFSVAFSNLLQFGQIALESDSCVGECNPQILEDFIKAESDKDSAREWSPYYHCILRPFISRLEFLAENGKASARPPQEGDAELKAIFDKIAASDSFQTA